MKSFSEVDFLNHFQQLGIGSGDNVVVHSNLMSFGLCEPSHVWSALRTKIGAEGTCVVPTYVFGSNQTYDPKTSQPSNIGAFSNFFWRQTNSVRSYTPIHNHAAIGPIASELLNNCYLTSFGSQSDFAWMSQRNFKLVLLGCPFSKGATFLHYLEAKFEVPYRRWVDSPKQILLGGKVKKIPFRYFDRVDEEWVENFDSIIPNLGVMLQTVFAHYGTSYMISLTDLERVVAELILENKHCLVKKS